MPGGCLRSARKAIHEKHENTDKEAPTFKEESDILLGCAIVVHNGIGYGFHEKPYENGLVVENK